LDFQDPNFDFPPIDVNFDISIPSIPECELSFQFNDLELYMEIDTILSVGATYTLNLYTSQTAIGIKINDELELGFIFTIDLILSVNGEIDISSGFHIQLDKVGINVPMFSQKIASIAQ
jgi:hypothetical protein